MPTAQSPSKRRPRRVIRQVARLGLTAAAGAIVVGALWSRGINLGAPGGRVDEPSTDKTGFVRAAARMPDGVPVIPVMVTLASGPVTVGATIDDTAFLSGGDGPTGTITFRLFGPSDPSCARAAVFV
ncbi:MAG: hypothetical protein QOF81_1201 [Acidimicrobiaceae bacterium]|nr:hypothetical protein [Acidimicrobiaceae bacterium]